MRWCETLLIPRIPRAQQAGFVYHVINRGNGRATIFHKTQDYQAFLSILGLAKSRHPVKMFAFSLMLNHFHFVIEASQRGFASPTGGGTQKAGRSDFLF
jgi:putative transposase